MYFKTFQFFRAKFYIQVGESGKPTNGRMKEGTTEILKTRQN